MSSAAGSSACFKCLYGTSYTASSWPLAIDDTALLFSELNAAGCFGAEAASELPCAQALEYQTECEHFDCDMDPSVVDLNSYQQCAATADTGDCKCFADAATSACAGFASTGCGKANAASTFDKAFIAMAGIVCGP